ncbi:MAG: YARHG domain-containing protein [Clostridia bacterium]|nr:YARHG domain-containing protein [Clostridia bacterium]
MYCPYCGAQEKEDSVFCGNCGKNMLQAAQNEQKRKNPAAETSKASTSIAPYIIVLLSVLIVCAVAILCVISVNRKTTSSGNTASVNYPTEATAPAGITPTPIPAPTPMPTPTPEATPTPPPEVENQFYDDYFFPSDTEYVTREFLDTLNRSEVALLRNEIYARHGYVFGSEPFKTYFEQKAWYIPDPDWTENNFSDIEKANRDLIVAYEREKGWRD